MAVASVADEFRDEEPNGAGYALRVATEEGCRDELVCGMRSKGNSALTWRL